MIKLTLMTENESAIYAHPRTHQFLVEALAEEAHLKQPPAVLEDFWARQKNIVGCYYLTPVRGPTLATIYGISRQALNISKLSGMRHLHGNCSPELQDRFPFETIPLAKPPTIELPKTITELSAKKDLQEALARKLRSLQPEDPETAQKILADPSLTHHFCTKHSQGQESLLVSLVNFIKASEGRRPKELRKFLTALDLAQIPYIRVIEPTKLGQQKYPYTYILRHLSEEADRTFRQDEGLAKHYQNPRPKRVQISKQTGLPNKIVCAECGAERDALPTHLRQAHRLTSAKYREKYGLPGSASLYSQTYVDYQSQAQLENSKDLNILLNRVKDQG